MAQAYEWGETGVSRQYIFLGDSSEGNSGAPVSGIGRFQINGQWVTVDHVIGMLTAEDSRPDVQMNFLTIFESEFAAAVDRAIEVAETLSPTGWD